MHGAVPSVVEFQRPSFPQIKCTLLGLTSNIFLHVNVHTVSGNNEQGLFITPSGILSGQRISEKEIIRTSPIQTCT